MLLKEHQLIHKQPELMCNMCNYAKKNQELLHKHKQSHCLIYLFNCDQFNYNNKERSWLKITRIFVCKCQYLNATFAKILIGIKMVEKHKTRKNQQIFYKCKMCNNTIKITTRKAAKGIKNMINAVDVQGVANNYDRQIQGQTNSRSTFVMLKKI